MNVANYSLKKQNVSVRAETYSNALSFTFNPVTLSMCYLSTFSQLFPCGFKSFLNFRLSKRLSFISKTVLRDEVLSRDLTCSVQMLGILPGCFLGISSGLAYLTLRPASIEREGLTNNSICMSENSNDRWNVMINVKAKETSVLIFYYEHKIAETDRYFIVI